MIPAASLVQALELAWDFLFELPDLLWLVLLENPANVGPELAQKVGRCIGTERAGEPVHRPMEAAIIVWVVGVLQGTGEECSQKFRGIESLASIICLGHNHACGGIPGASDDAL